MDNLRLVAVFRPSMRKEKFPQYIRRIRRRVRSFLCSKPPLPLPAAGVLCFAVGEIRHIVCTNTKKERKRNHVKIPHTQGYVACNTHRSGYLKPTQPSRLGLPLALWFVRIQARRHLCSHNSTWKTFRVAAASGHLTGTAYGQAVKP